SAKQSVRAIVIRDDKLLAMKRNKFGQHYYTLVGGGVDLGEDQETALRRELREETGLEVGSIRLVFVENGGQLFGMQYVYVCDYRGGDPVLDQNSEEAKISAMGQNTYEPLWLSLREISSVPFRSQSVAEAVLNGVKEGFPDTPQELVWRPEK
ncbi:MAG TPA: NUDIX domain-containing protein, partial [Verrucomicrobiae bacterium]|nr:NUDIX domain-containing protein [Verrucomicrobiae bacterium]